MSWWKDALATIGFAAVFLALAAAAFFYYAHWTMSNAYRPRPCPGFGPKNGCRILIHPTEEETYCAGHVCQTKGCGNLRLKQSCRCKEHHVPCKCRGEDDDAHLLYKIEYIQQ